MINEKRKMRWGVDPFKVSSKEGSGDEYGYHRCREKEASKRSRKVERKKPVRGTEC